MDFQTDFTAPELRLLVQHMAVKALVMLLQVGSAARQSDYLVCLTHIFHKWTGQMARGDHHRLDLLVRTLDADHLQSFAKERAKDFSRRVIPVFDLADAGSHADLVQIVQPDAVFRVSRFFCIRSCFPRFLIPFFGNGGRKFHRLFPFFYRDGDSRMGSPVIAAELGICISKISNPLVYGFSWQ